MEIISVHVPKTAGTTFGNLLVRHYGLDRVFKDYQGEDLGEVGPEIRVVHGHFIAGKYHGLYPEARRIAWIRHPVPWVISYYYFAKNVPRPKGQPLFARLHDDGLSLLEFAEHPFARNIVWRSYLYGLALEDYFFVGVQEHFRDDLAELNRRMGWPEVEVGVENTNPQAGYRERLEAHLADRALVRRIEALNELDMTMYDRVSRMRGHRSRFDPGGRASRPSGRLRALRSVFGLVGRGG